MEVSPSECGAYIARFWLFGHEITKKFKDENDAYVFLENIKATYVTEVFSIESSIEKYVRTVSKKKTPQTYTWEKYIFETFLDFLLTQGISKDNPVSKITLSILEEFQSWLKLEKRLSASTINRYFSMIKSFFKVLHKWDYIVKNPARFMSKLSEDPHTKNVWSNKDFDIVVNHLKPEDQVMLWFLRFTGARISSAVNLRIGEVDFLAETISLHTRKGPKALLKTYKFPMHNKLQKFILKILESHPTKKTNDYLLLSSNGKKFSNKYFSRRVQKVLLKAEVKDSVSNKLTLHGLRHTLATEMHSKGLTVDEIKNLLGHSSVTVTEKYLHTNVSALLSKMNKIA